MSSDSPARSGIFAPHPPLRDALTREVLAPGEMESLLEELRRRECLEEALAWLKRNREPRKPSGTRQALQARLEEESRRARERRVAHWQYDTRRRTLRLRLEVRPPATEFNPAALAHALVEGLKAAGLALALGLEKHPRPLLHLGHPLPLGAVGLSEWADAVLKEAPAQRLEELPAHLAPHLAPGLRILEIREVPNLSSPVLELCSQAHWSWQCPEELRERAESILRAYAQAEHWEIEKAGKVEGSKGLKRIDVGGLLQALHWEGPELRFRMALRRGEATNPAKVLVGLLGLAPGPLKGLTRLEVRLSKDPRLEDLERFEPKLHNIFEDAVLLDSLPLGSFREEDDDETLSLG